MLQDRTPHTTLKLLTTLVAIGLVAVIAVPAAINLDAAADQAPSANKAAVAGSTLAILTTGVTEGTDTVTATVLETTMKTSSKDLLLSLTAECALWTQTTTVGNDVSRAQAQVKMYVQVDGVTVKTTHLDDSLGDENGKVVFCDRVQESETARFENENATIRNYLSSRTANAFNWVLPDLEPGIHTIEVIAELQASVLDQGSEGGAELPGDTGFAKAAIGQRTLVVETIHLPQGATF